jgi:hypothetical protein
VTLDRVLGNIKRSEAARFASRHSRAAPDKLDEVTRGTIGDVIGRLTSRESGIPDSIFRHYELEEQRYVSRAFHRQNPRLKLIGFSELVLNETQARSVRTTLQRIQKRPVKDWVTGIVAAAEGARSKSRAEALRRVASGLVRAYLPKDLEQRTAIPVGWYKRFIQKLLRRHHHWRVDRILPDNLPQLPRPETRYLRRLVRGAGNRGGVGRQLVYLERVAARLQASGLDRERKRGEQLGEYLSTYKGSWAEPWLARRMSLFAGRDGPGWNLRSNLRFTGVWGIWTSEQRAVEHRLDEAWKILRGLVHPDLLKRLPPVKVVVDVSCRRAEHSGETITLGPRSSVATILHELGHHIEDHGGLTYLILAQSLRMERAHGSSKPLGKLVPGSSYRPDEEAFPSTFRNAYTAKKYSLAHGATEVISMALQRFASRTEARQFLVEDGEYALKVLYALQEKKPWPRARD